MKKIILIFPIFFGVSFSSCKKEPGEGGTSSIKGKVWVRKHDPGFTTVLNQYAGADEDVYIIYGEQIGVSDRVRTDYQGNFEFRFLRKGNYKIYVYSKDSAAIVGPPSNPTAPNMAIVKDVSITAKKQTVDVGTIVILK
jgi:hypothetical protein